MQGYITLALGLDQYVEMAANLAWSIRHFDKTRPICLVHDERVVLPSDVKQAFTHFAVLEAQDGYVGCMNKIRLDEVSPFDETLYIDADCLLVKDDIDRHWNMMGEQYFSMTGEKRYSGRWNNLDIDSARQKFSLPYVVQMNSGVFYFRRSPETERFFARLRSLYRDHRDEISNIHQGRADQYADEPFFGIAMGEFGLEPLRTEPGKGSLMVTTWRARNCDFRPEIQFSRIDKPSAYWFGFHHLPRHWIRHTPTIAHFIGLKPRSIYDRTVRYFRRLPNNG